MSQFEDRPMDDSHGDQIESQNVAQETPPEDVFIPPSIHNDRVLSGESYTHLSAVPSTLTADMSTECVLGVDEAGRGPVLGMYIRKAIYSQITNFRRPHGVCALLSAIAHASLAAC